MLLIWDFSVEQELSEKATPHQPHLPSAETLPMAPLLDVEKVQKHVDATSRHFWWQMMCLST